MRWQTIDVPFEGGANGEPARHLLPPGSMARVHNARRTRQGSWEGAEGEEFLDFGVDTDTLWQTLYSNARAVLAHSAGQLRQAESSLSDLLIAYNPAVLVESWPGAQSGSEPISVPTVVTKNTAGEVLIVRSRGQLTTVHDENGNRIFRGGVISELVKETHLVDGGSGTVYSFFADDDPSIVGLSYDLNASPPTQDLGFAVDSTNSFAGVGGGTGVQRFDVEIDSTHAYVAYKDSAGNITVSKYDLSSLSESAVHQQTSITISFEMVRCVRNPATGTLLVVAVNGSAAQHEAYTIDTSTMTQVTGVTAIGPSQTTATFSMALLNEDGDDALAKAAYVDQAPTSSGNVMSGEIVFGTLANKTFRGGGMAALQLLSNVVSVPAESDASGESHYVYGIWAPRDEPLQPHIILGWLSFSKAPDPSYLVHTAANLAIDHVDELPSVGSSMFSWLVPDTTDERGITASLFLGDPSDEYGYLTRRALTRPGTVPYAQIGQDIVYGSGLPIHTNGQQAMACVPQFYPDFSLSAVTAGGDPLADGTYSYILVLAAKYRDGTVARSATTAAKQVTTSGGNQEVRIQGTVIYVPIWHDAAEIIAGGTATQDAEYRAFIEVYRTEAGGTLFHFVGEERADIASSTTTQGEFDFRDNLADSELETRRVLYTTGGVLNNESPPAPHHIASSGGRVWVVSAEDRQTLWPSKLRETDATPAWNASLVVSMASTPGRVEAIADLDGRTVVLKEDAIYLFPGEGPNNLGSGSFGDPQLISSTVGCTNWRSVASTTDGIYFAHRGRMYFLNRSLQVTPVGSGPHNIEDDQATPTLIDIDDIASAAVDPAGHRVAWMLGSNLTMIIYDYLYGVWTTRLGGGSSTQNALVYADGEIWRLQVASSIALKRTDSDSITGNDVEIETPWYKLGSLQGFRRVRKLWLLGVGEGTDASGLLRVEAHYDFDEDPSTWADVVNESVSITEGRSFRRGIRLPRQKMNSIKFRMTVAPELRLTGMSFEVGGYPGLFRLPQASQR